MKPLEKNSNPTNGSGNNRTSNPSTLAEMAAAVASGPAAGLVQTLEQTANKIVDSVEQKAMEALASLEGKVGGLEQKANDFVGALEQKTLSAVDRIDEFPAFVDRSVRDNAYIALGIGVGLGILARVAQQTLPEGTLANWSKQGGQFLAKNAATWAMKALTQGSAS